MSKIDYEKVKTCDRCGRICEPFRDSVYCQACHTILEEKLDAVRTFIIANEGVSIEEVIVSLKVDRKQLIAWIRESRLKFSLESGVTVPCQKCSKPIVIGRFCSDCTTEMVTDLESAYVKPEVTEGFASKTPKTVLMNASNRRNGRKY